MNLKIITIHRRLSWDTNFRINYRKPKEWDAKITLSFSLNTLNQQTKQCRNKIFFQSYVNAESVYDYDLVDWCRLFPMKTPNNDQWINLQFCLPFVITNTIPFLGYDAR